MKPIFYAFFLSFIITSCSSSDDDNFEGTPTPTPTPTPPQTTVTFSVDADKNEANIFEDISFTLKSDTTFNIIEVNENYDSIVWIIPEYGRFHIIESRVGETSSYHSIHTSWSQNFVLPAKYNTTLTGYKNNKIVFSDTLSINITNNKDFLNYNWADIKETGTHGIGYADVIDITHEVTTMQYFENNIPSVLFYRNTKGNSDKEERLYAEETRDILYKEIESLYSTPTYTQDNPSKVQDMYQQLFTNKPADREPICIWVTPKSIISLLKYMDEYANYYEYEVRAEPNN